MRSPRSDCRRYQTTWNPRAAKQRLRHRNDDKEGDEQADAAVGDQRACEHDREDDPAFAQAPGDEARDRSDRAAVVHELSEHGAEQKNRKELREKLRRTTHEGLRPVGKQWLATEGCGHQRTERREQQHAPAAEGETDQQSKPDENAEKTHRLSTPPAEYRDLPSNAHRDRRHARRGIRRRLAAPPRAAWPRTPIRH